jgi:putative inorganic carbon (HCO3(-)) transporter
VNERFVFGYGTAQRSSAVPADPKPAAPAAVPPQVPPTRETRDWAYTGLLLFTALLYIRPQDTIRPLAFIPLAEIAALTALGAMVYSRVSRGLTMTRVTPELMGVAALGGLMVLLAPFSIWPTGSVQTFTNLFVKVLLIFLLILNTLTSARRVREFTWVVVLATSYIGLRAVFDYARGFNLVENGRVQGAVGGMFQNPNDLALNMVAVLPLAVLLAVRAHSFAGRMMAIFGALLMVGAVVASHSRSGFLGLAAMLMILLWQMGRRRPAIIGATAIAAIVLLPFAPDSYWERVASITDDDKDATGSREARRVLLGEAFQAFLDRPLTGLGAGQFVNYNPPGRLETWRETHNVVLQVAAELGIVGVAVFFFLVYRALMAGRQARRMLPLAIGTPARSRWGQTQAAPPAVLTRHDAEFFEAHTAALTAAVAGWLLSALFASVAYHWTFYYLLALAIAPREIVADRLADAARAARALRRSAPAPRLQEAGV